MARSMFVKLGFAACLAAAPLLPACFSGPDGTEDVESTGRASMSLVTQTNGRVYRLSNAIFAIEGPVFTYLSSTDDPDETRLTAALPTGDYLSSLQPGWVLERDDGGTFVPVQATLASGNPVPFTIFDGTTTQLVYQFQTDGTIITIGDGQLDIAIEVTEVGGGVCTPFGAGCAAGEWCVPGELADGNPLCYGAGEIPVGGSCEDPSLGCVTNALCGDLGTGLICLELCPVSQLGELCANGGRCNEVGYTEFGICF
ncbi:hypothetical protein [Sorangium sp. So ce131]|uniref:hypothetical protein n=1 Tax=Sorangium sp. So ce131 TaxID=3133282 RepID=UPI003F6236EE